MNQSECLVLPSTSLFGPLQSQASGGPQQVEPSQQEPLLHSESTVDLKILYDEKLILISISYAKPEVQPCATAAMAVMEKAARKTILFILALASGCCCCCCCIVS